MFDITLGLAFAVGLMHCFEFFAGPCSHLAFGHAVLAVILGPFFDALAEELLLFGGGVGLGE